MSKLCKPQSVDTEKMTEFAEKFGQAKGINVEAVAGCVVAGAGAVVGGLLFGSRGFFFGGLIGVTAACTISLGEVIRQMTDHLKKLFAAYLERVINQFIDNCVQYCTETLLKKIMGNSKLSKVVTAAINRFIQEKMHFRMVQ